MANVDRFDEMICFEETYFSKKLDKIKMEYNNKVIECYDIEKGKLIAEWWATRFSFGSKEHQMVTNSIHFKALIHGKAIYEKSAKMLNFCYYGIINGMFGAYSMNFIKDRNAKVIDPITDQWHTKVEKCPNCSNQIKINAISYESNNKSIHLAIKKYNHHLKQCTQKTKNKPIKFMLKVSTDGSRTVKWSSYYLYTLK